MKLAILGGAFNPFHLGHLSLAKKVKAELNYEKIAIIPAFISPFKQNSITPVTADDRIKMIELAIKEFPYLYCEKYEIEKKGVSYTIDTINYLYAKYPNLKEPIGLVIGDDHIGSFYKWKNIEELLQKINVIVAHRVLEKKENLKNIENLYKTTGSFPFIELHNSVLPISSTQIRETIAKKEEFKKFLPDSVYDYIINNNLYL